ncbi:MAG: MutS-related protein [Acidobacteriota bacterium]
MPTLRRLFGRVTPRLGETDVADARRLADAEQASGGEIAGCARLDARTIDDLDLGLVFRAIDRTASVIGAQALWRWLTAPAARADVLVEREQKLAVVSEPAVRDRICAEVAGSPAADAPFLPRLLWEEPAPPRPATLSIVLVTALAACLVLAPWYPALVLAAVTFGGVGIAIDTLSRQQLAEQAYALDVLGRALDAAHALSRALPEALAGGIRADLVARAALHKRLLVLRVKDPFDVIEAARAALQIRYFAIRSCMKLVDRERDRLRRIVLWLGELDALASIARLRGERAGTRVAELAPPGAGVTVAGLVHPVIERAIGNDLELAGAGLLITGSNMSGKSTFLRTLAINAILAQSIHTTFGSWRGPLLRVRAVMRIGDDIATGMSTYAVEVAAVGELVTAASDPDAPRTLFVLDEPFHGTNPTIRVPIVVSVLEYLATRGLVVAATHDLDVATRLDARFARGYFAELPEGGFDRTLHAGVAPSTNAIELLARAGYPAAILERVACYERS